MSTEITITETTIDINVTEYPITIEAPSGAYPLPTSVYSVFGRTGNVVATEGDYTLTQLAGVTITSPIAGQALVYNGSSWVNNTETYVGTVTSVNMSVPTGLTISGNPITTAGTLALGLASGYSIPTTASQATWNTAYNDSIVSAAVTGVQTKTLTLNQQDGGTVTASWTDSDATNLITEVYNKTGATLTKGTVVYISGSQGNLPAVSKALATSDATSAQTYGVVREDITNMNNGYVVVIGNLENIDTQAYPDGTQLYLSGTTAGTWTSTKPYAPIHLVYVGIVVRSHPTQGVVEIKIQNGYELDELHNVSAQNPTNGNILQYVTSTGLWTAVAGTTTNISEGTNLYYTQARFDTAFAAKTTTNLTEGTNLYFTNTRARAAISETVTGLDYNNTTGVLSTTTGYGIPTTASQTNWDTAYTNRITSASLPLSIAANAISISQANTTTNGYLSSTDWNTFNNKQAAGNYITALTGEATASGPGSASVTLTNSAVIGKVLTGLNVTGGTVVATDSILAAFGKVQNQINGLIGGSIYQGVWDASTNTPTLTSSVGTKGYYYIVNVAGSTNLNGITDWKVGDWAIYDGTAWQKVDNTDAVSSVNGFTGAVSLTTSNITEGTNLYFTDTRARNAITLTTTGTSGAATYSGGTLNIPQYQAVLTNPVIGTGTTNTLPKFTGTSAIGNSNITDSGSLITLGSDTYISSGGLGIGTSTITGYGIRINKNITGAASGYGVSVDGTIQSDVTTARIFGTQPSTIASAFTLGSLQHFTAGTTTIGAGSSITNQYGFLVLSTVIGATNNYAFAGQLAAATNTWNLYMSGTANNYMAGSLGIGRTSLSNMSLGIDKNMTGGTVVYGIYNAGTIQSDVTSSASYNVTAVSTVASSFTLTNLYHYLASQSTIGAGSTVTNQHGFNVSSALIGATNNYGFYGNIPSGTGRWNLYMNGTADNYLAGNIGIGNSPNFVSAGPILTTTLTNGGTGYVDATYTDVASTVVSGGGTYALFTIVVSGGIVTTATLTWGGSTYTAGTTLTVSNTLLGGTGSGLVITVNTVDSSQLTIASATGGDITLFRSDTSLALGENLGTIKWNSNDSSVKASGLQAEIGAFATSTLGGAYLSFLTRSVSAGTSLVEAMRIGSEGGVGIGATILTGYSLKISKNITGATTAYAIRQDGTVQSDVTSSASNFASFTNTAAASFTLGSYTHFSAQQGTIGAGSSITTQYGFLVTSNMTSATNNYGFYGAIPSGTNRWNLYMAGTAANYMEGSLGVGVTPTFKFQVYNASAGAVARFHSGSSDGRISCNSGVVDISSTGSDLSLTAGNSERVRVKSTGQMRFVPLASDPTGAAAGDVYYNSTTNALKLYDGTVWRTITVV
jgi:hypothetical protein